MGQILGRTRHPEHSLDCLHQALHLRVHLRAILRPELNPGPRNVSPSVHVHGRIAVLLVCGNPP